MSRRRALQLAACALALSLVTLVTACAAAAPEVAPGPAGETPTPSVPAAGTRPAGADAVPAAMAEAPTTDGLPGLSPRTTRGHVWADPSIVGDEVRLSAEVAALGDHVHLEVPGAAGVLGFIGYFSGADFHLRATVCPNCAAERIEWGVSLVVCRECGTTFDLFTGEASGDGRGYPQGSIPQSLDGDYIVFSLAELAMAHARTATGEETILPPPEVIEDNDRGDRSWPRCCVPGRAG